MDVKEFLSETMRQVIEGILDAQEQTKNKGAVVVPHGGSEKAVRFDIAVAVTEGTQASGIGSLQVYGDGSNVNGKSESSNSIVHRVQFEVPVEYPSGEESPTFGDDL
jgi:hypothetical protein